MKVFTAVLFYQFHFKLFLNEKMVKCHVFLIAKLAELNLQLEGHTHGTTEYRATNTFRHEDFRK